MSLKNLIIEKEEVDNSKPSLFIQILGGHCTGKSGIVGKLKQLFGSQITVLGKYKESKTNKGLLTGGMDGLSMDNKQRYSIIEEAFLSNDKIVICEGMMVIYYSSFILKYFELQEERNRDVLIVLLETDIENIKERLHRRSKGKEFTKKRLEHILSKSGTSKSTFDKIETNERYNKITYKTNVKEDFYIIVKELAEKIKEYIQ